MHVTNMKMRHSYHYRITIKIINNRCAGTARVISICLSIFLSVCESVTTLASRLCSKCFSLYKHQMVYAMTMCYVSGTMSNNIVHIATFTRTNLDVVSRECVCIQ